MARPLTARQLSVAASILAGYRDLPPTMLYRAAENRQLPHIVEVARLRAHRQGRCAAIATANLFEQVMLAPAVSAWVDAPVAKHGSDRATYGVDHIGDPYLSVKGRVLPPGFEWGAEALLYGQCRRIGDTLVGDDGRLWILRDYTVDLELWEADDSAMQAHGWAVCLPGDEPGHATWHTTTTEAVARAWLNNAKGA